MPTPYAMDIRCSGHQEADGTHTVVVSLTGIPTIDEALMVSEWLHRLVQRNASEIGTLEPGPREN